MLIHHILCGEKTPAVIIHGSRIMGEKVNNKESIEKTKQGFEDSFKSAAYYDKQTKDENHLELIVNFLQVKPGMRILDLGTGTGYLAFPFAERYKQTEIVGLDIVKNTLEKNRGKAELKGLSNLDFVDYEGMNFPFEDNSFDMVITRYALHHFPDIKNTFREINRVLKKDGHIKFYTKDEWKEIAETSELKFIDGFETTIRFPRKKETSLEFDDIIGRHDENVIKGYEVEVIDDEIWITEKVNNLLFQKIK